MAWCFQLFHVSGLLSHISSRPVSHLPSPVSHLQSHVLSPISCLLSHVSCLTSPISCPVSRLMSPVSHSYLMSCFPSPVSHLLSHILSPVSRLLSHVSRLLSHITYLTSCLPSPVSRLPSPASRQVFCDVKGRGKKKTLACVSLTHSRLRGETWTSKNIPDRQFLYVSIFEKVPYITLSYSRGGWLAYWEFCILHFAIITTLKILQ